MSAVHPTQVVLHSGHVGQAGHAASCGPAGSPVGTTTGAASELDRPFAGPWTWRKVAALPLLAIVRFYQLVISPLSGPSCRFYPSCSAYAVTALVRFGPVKGTWLAVRRLGRCHPWNPGGVDHVPPPPSPSSPAAD